MCDEEEMEEGMEEELEEEMEEETEPYYEAEVCDGCGEDASEMVWYDDCWNCPNCGDIQ